MRYRLRSLLEQDASRIEAECRSVPAIAHWITLADPEGNESDLVSA